MLFCLTNQQFTPNYVPNILSQAACTPCTSLVGLPFSFFYHSFFLSSNNLKETKLHCKYKQDKFLKLKAIQISASSDIISSNYNFKQQIKIQFDTILH